MIILLYTFFFGVRVRVVTPHSRTGAQRAPPAAEPAVGKRRPARRPVGHAAEADG